jgi:hypothetical protein
VAKKTKEKAKQCPMIAQYTHKSNEMKLEADKQMAMQLMLM